MKPRHLIDQLVRQTTVLIAQLSTASGIRAPLARVADQVFVELSREIESQGVSRKVAADMFGLALRTYQTRVQRLSQSQTMSDRTLWQAVLDFVDAQGNPSRASIVERFRNDGELAVGAVLNDLATSGLISVTGKGPNALCRVTSEADRHALSRSADADSVASQSARLRRQRQRVHGDEEPRRQYRRPRVPLAPHLHTNPLPRWPSQPAETSDYL